MKFATFVANFFRQGAAESSTRLVGISSFFAAVGLAYYMVITGHTNGGEVTTLGMTFANACIALGLRARQLPADTPAADAATP